MTHVSGWCQRWRDRKAAWRLAHPGEPFTGAGYDVRPILDDTTAERYVRAHHYSGSYPSALHRFGLYRGADLVGVAVYSFPTNVRVLTNAFPELRPGAESVELGRFVLDDVVPGNGETWMLARCHELLTAAGVAGVVSHADPHPWRDAAGVLTKRGHVGTAYAAGNAIYTAKTGKRTVWLLRDGTMFSEDAKGKVRKQAKGHRYAEALLTAHGARPMRASDDPHQWLAEAKVAAGVRTQRHGGCHRFLFVLGDRRTRRAVKLGYAPVWPYPKTIETRELVAT